jgi:transcriptional regulator with XRE-family HTH domain
LQSPEILSNVLDMKNKAFSALLKSTRRKLDQSQDVVSEILDVAKPSYSRWECGDGLPQANKLLAISKWAKIEPLKLLRLLARK